MASRFWVGGTGTWDASDTTHWAATSNGAGGQSVPTTNDTVTFDASSGGGTVTVNTNVSLGTGGITMGAFTGTLDFATNNNSVNMATFSGTGTGTRTLNMGSNTWTLTQASGSDTWNTGTTTNFTFNKNTSTLAFTGTGGYNFTPGNLSFNVVTIGAHASGSGTNFNLSGTLTIATLNVTAPNYIFFTVAGAVTITNAPTWTGTSSQPILIGTSSYVAAAPTLTISSGAPSLTWCALRNITWSGSTGTATSSLDLGGNTNITITAPTGTAAAGVIGS